MKAIGNPIPHGREALPDLLALGERVGALLAGRGETLAVAESSAGGLIAAALLSRAGASAYFLGGAIVYTRRARRLLTSLKSAVLSGIRSASPQYASVLAHDQRIRFSAHWGLAETGAAGPEGNAYGDAAGHSCLAVDGPVQLSRTLATGQAVRASNMVLFAAAALELLEQALRQSHHPMP